MFINPKHVLRAFVVAGAAGAACWVVIAFMGDGTLQARFTLGGIYAVERPGNYPVVCFVEKSIGAMSCLQLNGQ